MSGIIGRENLSSPTPSFIIGNKILKTFLDQGVKAYKWVSEVLTKRVNYLVERDIPLLLPENGKFGALFILMNAPERGSTYSDKLAKEGIISVTGEPFYGRSVDLVRLSLVSVPYANGDNLWKENVDNLAKTIG